MREIRVELLASWRRLLVVDEIGSARLLARSVVARWSLQLNSHQRAKWCSRQEEPLYSIGFFSSTAGSSHGCGRQTITTFPSFWVKVQTMAITIKKSEEQQLWTVCVFWGGGAGHKSAWFRLKWTTQHYQIGSGCREAKQSLL